MHQFLQQVFSGLAAGAVYASLALALVMIYRATDLVNFAQGEMAMFSTYIAWTLVNAGLPFWAAFVLTLVLIRQRDFVDVQHAQPGDAAPATSEADAPPATVAAR